MSNPATRGRIVRTLNSYSPSQAAVIHEMAAERGLDPDKLAPIDYRALLLEEAEFSIHATSTEFPNEIEEALIYSADLLALADAL